MRGIGAMLGDLTIDNTSAETYKNALGKVIKSAELDPDRGDGGSLLLRFTDGSGIEVWDDGRSYCESRYMTTDDDLSSFVGYVFNSIEMRDGPDATDEYGEPHDMIFVYVNTSLGVFTLEAHNIHNGCYGGFWIRIQPLDAPAPDAAPTSPADDSAQEEA